MLDCNEYFFNKYDISLVYALEYTIMIKIWIWKTYDECVNQS